MGMMRSCKGETEEKNILDAARTALSEIPQVWRLCMSLSVWTVDVVLWLHSGSERFFSVFFLGCLILKLMYRGFWK